MTKYTLDDPRLLAAVKRVIAGESARSVAKETRIDRDTIAKRISLLKQQAQADQSIPSPQDDIIYLFVDIETLPNRGLFFDTYSEKSIPLDFILDPKTICVIGYKFSNEDEVHVLVCEKPYSDESILEQFLPQPVKADYIVWHFGEGFDRKFIEGRLWANGLPALPDRASIDTYKLAKAKWGRTLNSNKLDHLAKLCGLPGKIRTSADLWVRCAKGDLDAMEEMALYNKNDVLVLEQVFYRLSKNVKTKVNHNLFHDDPINRCKTCGSENITLKGHKLMANSLRHTFQCECGAWSDFARTKT